MIHHVWTVLCWRSSIDQARNNISLLEIVEEMTLRNIPTESLSKGVLSPIELQLVTLWTRGDPDSPCSGKGRIQFLNPSGDVLSEVERNIDLQNSMRRRLILAIEGLPLKGEEGRYIFRVQLQEGEAWKDVAQIPLEVKIISVDSESTDNNG
jgi:phage-related baseplate assembly protein